MSPSIYFLFSEAAVIGYESADTDGLGQIQTETDRKHSETDRYRRRRETDGDRQDTAGDGDWKDTETDN